MLQLLRIIAMVVVIIIVLNNGSIVRSAHFCGYTSMTSTCPGDDQVEISYPFWIGNRTTDDNGDCISYPGFQVKCAANGRPVISFSNNLYYVLNIDANDVRMTVVDVVIDAQECPQPRRNISFQPMRFLYFYDVVTVNIFYNCSRHPQNVVQHMPCLDHYHSNTTATGQRSFAFLEEEISSHHFDWYQNCEEAVVVPVGISNGGDSTSMNYTEALKIGFYLYWSYPVNCDNCELSGGNCLENETNRGITTPFTCNCGEETYQDEICPDEDEASVTPPTTATATPTPTTTPLPPATPTDHPRGAGTSIGLKVVIGVPISVGGLLLCLLAI